jgi:hypothetical protein
MGDMYEFNFVTGRFRKKRELTEAGSKGVLYLEAFEKEVLRA